MSIPKVCRYCSNYRNGVCTAEFFELTDSEGYDWGPGTELKHAVDMGEILEVIESVTDNEALRAKLDEAISIKLNNLADEMETPKTMIKDPESFGCNLWR